MLKFLPRRSRTPPTGMNPAELLYTSEADALVLPTIPSALRHDGEASINFAAASVMDRVALAALVRRHRPMRLFEIGTFRGVTAVTMAANAPDGSVLYTLDLPPTLSASDIARAQYGDQPGSGFHRLAAAGVGRDVGRLLAHYSGACRIEQIFADSATMDWAPYHDSIDLFFVDGCHSHEMALQDTRTAWRCLRSGGILVWHDYPWPGVQAAIRDAGLGVAVTPVAGSSVAFAQKN